ARGKGSDFAIQAPFPLAKRKYRESKWDCAKQKDSKKLDSKVDCFVTVLLAMTKIDFLDHKF
ncbi:hypothetical protein, partial [Helicobacter sp. MIT 99-10781]|uniref:hypothetical protein n=1 Tax=Helicobacter sp. MIT 99-10781 TaxID=1332285 RepID=UPI001C6A0780